MIAPERLMISSNRLLRSLPRNSLEALAPHATAKTFLRSHLLSEADLPIPTALFVEEGVASVTKPVETGPADICLVGLEGFCGLPIVVGNGRWPYRTLVQTDQLRGLEIDANVLRSSIERDGSLRRLMLGSVHVTLIQIAENLASHVALGLRQRVSRWLLMYRDRCRSERLEITHQYIAMMMGATRSGITNALNRLEGKGLIAAQRGVIVVRDVEGLQKAADGGYGTAEIELTRLVRSAA